MWLSVSYNLVEFIQLYCLLFQFHFILLFFSVLLYCVFLSNFCIYFYDYFVFIEFF